MAHSLTLDRTQVLPGQAPTQPSPEVSQQLQQLQADHAAPEPTGTARMLDTALIREARIDLAACFRAAARHGLQEGICNHFSAVVPGHDDLFLVNPFGLAFEEITASSLLICDFLGNVLAGDGVPEATAFYIHARLHLRKPRARAAFHTHMPNATALCLLRGEPLAWAGQTALKFYGRTAVDENYNGLALDNAEGDRIATAMGDADVVFLKNHGVVVIGQSIAEAWDDLYYLERAAEVQIKALSTGRPLKPVSPALAAACSRQMRAGDAHSARLHLASIRRVLMREQPDFAA
jgi:ribulose-5-phosphate 4-epimerase/fuculose-1-phosphate aldolase